MNAHLKLKDFDAKTKVERNCIICENYEELCFELVKEYNRLFSQNIKEIEYWKYRVYNNVATVLIIADNDNKAEYSFDTLSEKQQEHLEKMLQIFRRHYKKTENI